MNKRLQSLSIAALQNFQVLPGCAPAVLDNLTPILSHDKIFQVVLIGVMKSTRGVDILEVAKDD